YRSRGPSGRSAPRGCGVAWLIRDTAQRHGATGLQAMVDAVRAAVDGAQHLRAAGERGAHPALLAVATDLGGDLVGQRPRGRLDLAGDLLARLGRDIGQHIPDQSLRAVRAAPGLRELARREIRAYELPDAALLQGRPP